MLKLRELEEDCVYLMLCLLVEVQKSLGPGAVAAPVLALLHHCTVTRHVKQDLVLGGECLATGFTPVLHVSNRVLKASITHLDRIYIIAILHMDRALKVGVLVLVPMDRFPVAVLHLVHLTSKLHLDRVHLTAVLGDRADLDFIHLSRVVFIYELH